MVENDKSHQRLSVDTHCIPLVNYFNSIGLKTHMSCEGHNETNKSMFWIEFDKAVAEEDIEAFLIQLREKYGSSATCGCFAMRIFPGPKYTIRRWRYMAATKEAAERDFLFFTTGQQISEDNEGNPESQATPKWIPVTNGGIPFTSYEPGIKGMTKEKYWTLAHGGQEVYGHIYRNTYTKTGYAVFDGNDVYVANVSHWAPNGKPKKGDCK